VGKSAFSDLSTKKIFLLRKKHKDHKSILGGGEACQKSSGACATIKKAMHSDEFLFSRNSNPQNSRLAKSNYGKKKSKNEGWRKK
jgi:hypothetical protein